MKKLKILFTKPRQHYWNRLKKRHGNHINFIFAKHIIDTEYGTEIWKYKNNMYFVKNYQLQKFI